ncbi:MAG: S-adenosylmethionine decarboxylase proenzyme precursor [Syntrophorhabdus sp. PtaU1.Bin050]|nr:MAG: S-adenosylmethionine decarboxylase proenzyme precursor [Syntrophorhabdus sp. PtaU1.Bin050]
MKMFGRYGISRLCGCDSGTLDGVETMRRRMDETMIVRPLLHEAHPFSPCGMDDVEVTAESCFTINPWPEYGYAVINLFARGSEMGPLKAKPGAKHSTKMEIKRGHSDFLGKEITQTSWILENLGGGQSDY